MDQQIPTSISKEDTVVSVQSDGEVCQTAETDKVKTDGQKHEAQRTCHADFRVRPIGFMRLHFVAFCTPFWLFQFFTTSNPLTRCCAGLTALAGLFLSFLVLHFVIAARITARGMRVRKLFWEEEFSWQEVETVTELATGGLALEINRKGKRKRVELSSELSEFVALKDAVVAHTVRQKNQDSVGKVSQPIGHRKFAGPARTTVIVVLCLTLVVILPAICALLGLVVSPLGLDLMLWTPMLAIILSPAYWVTIPALWSAPLQIETTEQGIRFSGISRNQTISWEKIERVEWHSAFPRRIGEEKTIVDAIVVAGERIDMPYSPDLTDTIVSMVPRNLVPNNRLLDSD